MCRRRTTLCMVKVRSREGWLGAGAGMCFAFRCAIYSQAFGRGAGVFVLLLFVFFTASKCRGYKAWCFTLSIFLHIAGTMLYCPDHLATVFFSRILQCKKGGINELKKLRSNFDNIFLPLYIVYDCLLLYVMCNYILFSGNDINYDTN